MPGEPEEVIESIDTLVGSVEMIMYMHEEITIASFVAYADYPLSDTTYFDSDMAIDGEKQGLVSSMGGTISNERQISISGYPEDADSFFNSFTLLNQ
jgi:hypothetical protein